NLRTCPHLRRKACDHGRSAADRAYIEIAAEFLQALPHARDADAALMPLVEGAMPPAARPAVDNAEFDGRGPPREPDIDNLIGGMANHVAQALLHYAEDDQLRHLRQASQLGRDSEVDADTSALGKAFR